MVNVAILGYGTVGSGVYDVITRNNSHIGRRAGKDINVKYVLDLREFPGDPAEKILVHDFDTILNDDDVDIVVEVMGGVEPAHTFVKNALLRGKSVCTSNKEMVAKFGAELLEIAKEKNSNFVFEASVGGGIPVIRSINESLTVDHFDEISGILNGTTNYILTKMDKEGLAFDAVLKDAQDKGYAERNPEADIEGYDACRKIAILASLCYEKQVDFEDIYTEGITKISSEDFAYARKLGYSIKLLGTARKIDGKVYAMVAPFMLDEENPLHSVSGVFNAIKMHGDMLGNVMLYGKGAGKHATASAVVSDVIDCARNLGHNKIVYWSPEKRTLGDIDTFTTKFFVRVKGVVDKAALEEQFGGVTLVSGIENETAFITEEISEAKYKKAAENFEVINKIRISK
ncbi:MAG: homoserine dehydrogenase [Eubacterium sp.]|nr:homoserine dehydrogenase [Eubacterium sp.]